VARGREKRAKNQRKLHEVGHVKGAIWYLNSKRLRGNEHVVATQSRKRICRREGQLPKIRYRNKGSRRGESGEKPRLLLGMGNPFAR